GAAEAVERQHGGRRWMRLVEELETDAAHLLGEALRQRINAAEGDVLDRASALLERFGQTLKSQPRVRILVAVSNLRSGQNQLPRRDQRQVGKVRRSRQARRIFQLQRRRDLAGGSRYRLALHHAAHRSPLYLYEIQRGMP